MTVHANSIASFVTLSKTERCRAILTVYRESVRGLTDRQVMEAMGFTDGNSVKPRISEMVDDGRLAEVGKVKCHVTGKTVRICMNTTA